MHSELEEDQTMVNPLQLASMLVDWMDPEKTVYAPLSYIYEYLLTIPIEKCPAARRTTPFTLTLLRTLSEHCLMTISRVRKIILSPHYFYQ